MLTRTCCGVIGRSIASVPTVGVLSAPLSTSSTNKQFTSFTPSSSSISSLSPITSTSSLSHICSVGCRHLHTSSPSFAKQESKAQTLEWLSRHRPEILGKSPEELTEADFKEDVDDSDGAVSEDLLADGEVSGEEGEALAKPSQFDTNRTPEQMKEDEFQRLWARGKPKVKKITKDAHLLRHKPLVATGHGSLVYNISLVHFHHALMESQIIRLRKRFGESIPRIASSPENRAILDKAVVGHWFKFPVKIKTYTVLKAPKLNKTARDQYVFRTHKAAFRVYVSGLSDPVFIERFEKFLWQCVEMEEIPSVFIRKKQVAHQF